MVTREDFIFTIGFDGAQAVVDGRAKREYGKLSTRELVGAGQYRAAFASALWSGKDEDMREFLELFNQLAGTDYQSSDALKRLFGVQKEDVAKVMVL